MAEDVMEKRKLLFSQLNWWNENFNRTRGIEHIDKCVDLVRDIMKTMHRDETCWNHETHRLSAFLHARYTRCGKLADLQEAMEKVTEAVEATSLQDPERARRLSDFGIIMYSWFERFGHQSDLEVAIEKLEDAVQIGSPRMFLDLPRWLSRLADMLHRRFTCTGDLQDEQMAIEKAEDAEKLAISSGDPDLMSDVTLQVATLFMFRFDRTGQMSDLKLAIDKTETSMLLIGTTHPLYAEKLFHLANMLNRRFAYTRHATDLDMAIQKVELSVSMVPDNHPNLAMYLAHNAHYLSARFKETSEISDLDKALELMSQAINITPADNRRFHQQLLGNLAYLHHCRYQHTRGIEDLEIAIAKAEDSMTVDPADDWDLMKPICYLGNMLESRYRETKQLDDLERAIQLLQKADRMMSPGHTDSALNLKELGDKQLLHPDPERRADAFQSFLRAWCSEFGLPIVRLVAAEAAVNFLIDIRSWGAAAELATKAIDLLVLMSRRSLTHDEQQRLCGMFNGLAARACSVFLEAGRSPEAALKVLEQGRGSILGLLIDDRHDSSQMYRMFPQQAEEYDRLRKEVNANTYQFRSGESNQERLNNRIDAAEQLEECICRIRQLPGLERFLLGASTAEVLQQAQFGPIVVVNVTDIRSDAIIVDEQRIELICLPTFSALNLRSWDNQRFTEFTRANLGHKNKMYLQFLAWLWESCVKVVLDSLHQKLPNSRTADPKPRVWWIGTGQASAVPFHAAGEHGEDSINNTISHVVSSYTPTIKALRYARERLDKINGVVAGQEQKLCIVTMPQTPGMEDLPHIKKELSNVRGAVPSSYAISQLTGPTAAEVQDELQHCQLFHFAGHGIACAENPSQSCLVLQRPDENSPAMLPDRLSVHDVARMQLPGAQMAYLSACSTAENNSILLPDETIHLVSGFQVAGFPHVIGSMWTSPDEVCAELAWLFYQSLRTTNHRLLEHGAVARGLHSAIVNIRQQRPKQPLLWTQYVHFGC